MLALVMLCSALSAGAPGPAGLAGTQGSARRAPVASTSERLNVEFQDADLRSVLRTLSELGRVNIVIEQGVGGRVTATLRGVTWREALGQILRSQGLEAQQDGNVIYVRPAC